MNNEKISEQTIKPNKYQTYNPAWQRSRIDFILSKYPKDFFVGKRILELGSFNGYIGTRFSELGATVVCVEGRQENIDNIKSNYPHLQVYHSDLDTPVWSWGKFDIIINFGLYYHLATYHRDHLINCLNNCDLMFFESVIWDNNQPVIYYQPECQNICGDQGLSPTAGIPSTSYIENILKECNSPFIKFSDPKLNGDTHHYDWVDSNSNSIDGHRRRFWIINNLN